VRIRGLGAFEGQGDHVVYLDLANAEQVVALRGFLLKQLLPLVLPENERVAQVTLADYHPHVTLGLGLSDARLREVRARAMEQPIDLSFDVDCVWLATQAGADPWRYIRSFVLGGDTPAPCDADPH
jgi:2'-5' RNA ligase